MLPSIAIAESFGMRCLAAQFGIGTHRPDAAPCGSHGVSQQVSNSVGRTVDGGVTTESLCRTRPPRTATSAECDNHCCTNRHRTPTPVGISHTPAAPRPYTPGHPPRCSLRASPPTYHCKTDAGRQPCRQGFLDKNHFLAQSLLSARLEPTDCRTQRQQSACSLARRPTSPRHSRRRPQAPS